MRMPENVLHPRQHGEATSVFQHFHSVAIMLILQHLGSSLEDIPAHLKAEFYSPMSFRNVQERHPTKRRMILVILKEEH